MPILKTADRVLAILQVLATRGEKSARELSTQLEINLSTTYNLLETLQAHRLIERAPDYRFRLVPDNPNLGLGTNSGEGGQLKGFTSELCNLHDLTGETCYLTVLQGSKVSIVEMIEGTSNHLRVAGLHIGFSGWEHMRASGRAVLAFLPDGEVRLRKLQAEHGDLLDASTRDAVDLFEVVRATGIAVDAGEFEDGIHCVAAPYFANGEVIGSIAVSLPSARFFRKANVLQEQVHRAGRSITGLFGELAGTNRLKGER